MKRAPPADRSPAAGRFAEQARKLLKTLTPRASADRLLETLRAGAAGIAATAADLATLTFLVSAMHVDPRAASAPALVVGGVANFLGNRHFAFRAQRGSLLRQATLYTLVEVMALGLNALLYDQVLRAFPATRDAYWAVRLVSSQVVFLAWSLPLWRRVFAADARA